PKYPSLHASHLSITLIEAADRLVGTARPDHAAYVLRFLERRGVRVKLQASVVEVRPKQLRLQSGETMDAFTIVWTAGVRPPEVVEALPVEHVHDGRVRVDERLCALGSGGTPIEDVFVIGDCAAAARHDGTFQP